MVLKEYQLHISAGALVSLSSGHHVLCGPAVVPAGGAPVNVQGVLEGVDVGCLLYIIWERIVVSNNPVPKEEAPLLMLVVPWPDGMESAGIPGGSCPLPPPVHLQVKL